MQITISLIEKIISEADSTHRRRQSIDLRTSPRDHSQRILTALFPGTDVPIHRHNSTTETLVLLRGKMEEIYYDVVDDYEEGGDSRCADVCRRKRVRETQRILLEAGGPVYGLCIPVGQWHGINVLEPTVILECKDGAYEPLGPEDVIE